MQATIQTAAGWQSSPYSVILGVTALCAATIALVVWRRRGTPGAVPVAS